MMVFLFSASSLCFCRRGTIYCHNGQPTSFSNKPFLKWNDLYSVAHMKFWNVMSHGITKKQIAEIKDKSSGRTVAIGAKNYTVNNVTKNLTHLISSKTENFCSAKNCCGIIGL